jgi:predicted DCC family thiol-disulfide oxidoreductase YuxK
MTTNYPLTLLYDGACPVCMLEMDNIKARNTAGLLLFTDVSLQGFDPLPFGATLAQMNALIHAVRPDGTLVVGVEVFRLAYGAVGLGRWAAPTGWPLLKPLVDALYALFARHRYLASRYAMPLLTRIAAARAAKRAKACAAGTCETPNP